MFNGIIYKTGTILKIDKSTNFSEVTIKINYSFRKSEIGSSICCNGTCLTITKIENSCISFYLSKETLNRTNFNMSKIGDIINVERVTDTFTNLVGGLGNLAFALFSILFISFFFLREQHLFRTIIMAFVPARFEARVKRISPRLRSNLSRYFVGLLIQITIITTLVSLGLKLGGFHNTIVIGFFAGLINVIPYLGPVIGLSFGIILGMAQTLGDASMEFASGFFIIIGVFAFR